MKRLLLIVCQLSTFKHAFLIQLSMFNHAIILLSLHWPVLQLEMHVLISHGQVIVCKIIWMQLTSKYNVQILKLDQNFHVEPVLTGKMIVIYVDLFMNFQDLLHYVFRIIAQSFLDFKLIIIPLLTVKKSVQIHNVA